MIFMDLIDDDEDKDRFRMIYEQYSKHLYYIIYEMTRNHHKAEDVLQETYLRIAKNIYRIDTSDSMRLKKYLEIIAGNVALTIINEDSKVIIMELKEDDVYNENYLTRDTILDEISKEELINIIRKLDRDERDILLMYYFYDNSIKEIADTIGIKYETVKKRMQRAVKKLSGMIRREDYYES